MRVPASRPRLPLRVPARAPLGVRASSAAAAPAAPPAPGSAAAPPSRPASAVKLFGGHPLSSTLASARAQAAASSRAVSSGAELVLETADEFVSVGPGPELAYWGPAAASDAAHGAEARGAVRISAARLRDACPCARCIDPSTRQKTHTSGEAWAEVRGLAPPLAGRVRAAERAGERGVAVAWPAADGQPHDAFYPVSLLRRLASAQPRGGAYHVHGLRRRLWDAAGLQRDAPALWTDYASLHDGAPDAPFAPRPAVLLAVLEQLQRFGLAVVRGVPTAKTGNTDASIRALAEAIGPLRNTFYGETWNVQSVADSKNVAYTSLNLGLHMDLCYYQLPPRFQFLHCLRNRVVGGASYFVDSFAAAERLRAAHPRAFRLLQQQRVTYEYDNDGHYMADAHPVLPRSVTADALRTAVFWSPPFQAPPQRMKRIAEYASASASASEASAANPANPANPATRVDHVAAEDAFYEALALFQAELDNPALRYEFTMQEGDAVLFDNNRVLHARTAFRDKTDDEIARDGTVITPGEPTRWLKGLYLDGSTVWDRLSVLNDQVRGRLA